MWKIRRETASAFVEDPHGSLILPPLLGNPLHQPILGRTCSVTTFPSIRRERASIADSRRISEVNDLTRESCDGSTGIMGATMLSSMDLVHVRRVVYRSRRKREIRDEHDRSVHLFAIFARRLTARDRERQDRGSRICRSETKNRRIVRPSAHSRRMRSLTASHSARRASRERRSESSDSSRYSATRRSTDRTSSRNSSRRRSHASIAALRERSTISQSAAKKRDPSRYTKCTCRSTISTSDALSESRRRSQRSERSEASERTKIG